MKAEEVNLLKFLNSPKQLIIPIYQRAYSWEEKECKQLWKDIIKAGENDTISGHFVGSIVYVEKGLYQASALPKLLVIDGQQRLTTLSLLISALYNHIKYNKTELKLDPEKLASYYLLNDKEVGEDKYKLILTKNDKTTLFKVLDELQLTEDDSKRIKENYEFFKDEIAKTDLNAIYEGISKLIIIDVSLDREKDNPQLIFESLNSTGLELTQADLIRNYILMGLEKNEQEELYNNFWFVMEKAFRQSTSTDEFDSFVRSYLIMKENKIPKIKEIYQAFKLFSKKFNSIKNLVIDLHQFSKYYVNFSLEKEPDQEIKNAFIDINELKVDVSYPFILSVYHDFVNGIIKKEQFIEILRLIESYVFRRAICGVPTNSLNKTFSTLHKKIDKENYVESINAILVLQDSYRRMPDNDEFKRGIQIKDLYHFRNRNYILRKLENHDRKEFVDVESYTIEHIMPQNPRLSNQWKNDLGENWKEIQKTYLHTIGNLTLTGYNSELSDKPFKEKRDMKGGFNDSPIRMNRGLANIESWNEVEIKKRSEKITKLAINVWIYPDVENEILDKYRTVDEEETKQKYTISDHEYLEEGQPMRPLFDELRKRILNIDSSVREEPQKLYIAYKSNTNFVDIIPQKKALRLSLNIPFEKINDTKEICRDVSGKGRWGNGDTEVKIIHFDELDYILNLIKQAFVNIEEDNGN